MSIILEGKLNREVKSGSIGEDSAESPELTFTGNWYFIREKSCTLPFTYTYKSAEVPKDLIDFVSFIDHKAPMKRPAQGAAKKKASRSRSNNRSKNQRSSKSTSNKRVRYDSNGLPILDGEGLAELPIMTTENPSIAIEAVVNTEGGVDVGEMKEIKEEPVAATSTSDTTADDVKDEIMAVDGANADRLDGKDGSAQEEDEEDGDEGPDDSDVIAGSDIIPDELKGAGTVKIDRKHPLFGLWEGSFGIGARIAAPTPTPVSTESEVKTASVGEETKDQMEVVNTETAATTATTEESTAPSTAATESTTTPVESAVTADTLEVPAVDTSVAPTTGGVMIDDSDVSETFFFHSYLNVEPTGKGLEVLPSEPCFTYTVIKSLKRPIVPENIANEILGVEGDTKAKAKPIPSVVKEVNEGKLGQPNGNNGTTAATTTAAGAVVAAQSTMAVDPSKIIVKAWSSSNPTTLAPTVPTNLLDTEIPVRTPVGSLNMHGKNSIKSNDVKVEKSGEDGLKVEAEVAAGNGESPQKMESATKTPAASHDMDIPSTPPIKSTPDTYGLNAPVKPEVSDSNQLGTDATVDTGGIIQDADNMVTSSESVSDSSVKLLLMRAGNDVPEEEGKHTSSNVTIVNGATDGTDSTGLVVLVGFGRNRFGRFSIVASYDPVTSALVAEKRYMLSKNATNARKTRRATTVANPSLGIAIGSSLGQRSAAANNIHTNSSLANRFSIDGEYYSGTFPLSLAAAASKKRKNSHVGLATEDEDEEDGNDPEYKNAYYDESSGDVYEGGWHPKFKVRHGRGVLLYNDGNMYEGSFNLGKEHGKGKLMAGNRKIIYSGDWQEGTFHGHGKYFFFNKDVYEGDFREGARTGRGSYTTSDSCVYTGEWRDNKRHGKGSFVWPDGSSYDGEWENDMRQGKGHLLLAKGVEYEGAFSRNALDGRGTFIFPGGLKYEGAFRAGLREGRGSLSFAEGAIYEGRFREDRLDGQGTVKVHKAVPGPLDGETMIPIEIQADIRRIHLKAGFGADEH